MQPDLRMYADLASWWPLLSAPADYAEEAAFFLDLLDLRPAAARPRTLLELGSGGGNLASHLKAHVEITLCDRAPAMLAVSRSLNPDLEHVQGDMRSIRLGRTFDVVMIHDAVMYCTDPPAVREALATAASHCRPGGRVLVAPDCVRETFEPHTSTGGHDAPDGRGLRYLEWVSDPDPTDTTFETLYAIVLREASGEFRVELDRHLEGLFGEREWLDWLRTAGFAPRSVVDPWSRHVFVGTKAES